MTLRRPTAYAPGSRARLLPREAGLRLHKTAQPGTRRLDRRRLDRPHVSSGRRSSATVSESRSVLFPGRFFFAEVYFFFGVLLLAAPGFTALAV